MLQKSIFKSIYLRHNRIESFSLHIKRFKSLCDNRKEGVRRGVAPPNEHDSAQFGRQAAKGKLYTNVTANLLSSDRVARASKSVVWEIGKTAKKMEGMRARGASPIFPASHRAPVVCFVFFVRVCVFVSPQKKRKTFVALPEQRGEKGKNEISFAGKLTKANYHLRFGFVLHLLIVLPGCHVDLKVGNTAQHQDIVNPKWNADRKKGRNFNHKNRTP